jgi:hypothetical protein
MRVLATLGVTTILVLSANVSAQQANEQVGGTGAAIANSTVTPAVSGDKTPILAQPGSGPASQYNRSDSPRADTARGCRHLRSSRLRRIRKLRDSVLAFGAQLRLISLQALSQLLSRLAGTHLLGVRSAHPRDNPVFAASVLRFNLSPRSEYNTSDNYEMGEFHMISPSTLELRT